MRDWGKDGGGQDVPLRALRAHLQALAPGPVQDVAGVLEPLREAWASLDGSTHSGMASFKLTVARVEVPTWSPPVFSFRIERHGGTVLGSTRAEMETWEVDVEAGTAGVTRVGHRQLRPMARREYMGPLAHDVADLIVQRSDAACLRWAPDHSRVAVMVGAIVPGTGPQQTVRGRRKRFRDALRAALAPNGWTPDASRPNTYQAPPKP